jgi:hypothetical protein
MAKAPTKTQMQLFEGFDSREEHDKLMTRLLAGSAKFTLTSGKTGNRFTFWLRSGARDRDKTWNVNNQNRKFYFAKVLNGPDNGRDYLWIASIRRTDDDSHVISFDPRNEHRTAPSRFALEWFLHQVFIVGVVPENVSIDWASSCNRCGRELTVPESIRSGYGPECIAHA